MRNETGYSAVDAAHIVCETKKRALDIAYELIRDGYAARVVNVPKAHSNITFSDISPEATRVW